ncbi:tetratricopeptide repeat protein 28-like [Oculina patagonica]
MGNYKHATEYHNQGLRIAKELGDRNGEGRAFYSLGMVFEFSGSVHEALDYYRSSVKVYDDVRALLQSEDDWKISFRNACQCAYTALYRNLVKLARTDEALCVAEQGRAQALKDLIKLQYDSELLASGSLEPDLSGTSAQTVFVAHERNTIYLWLLKGTDVHFETTSIEDATFLVEKAFEEIGVRAHVKCENRSLDEPEGDESPNNESSQGIEDSKNNSLRQLFDSIMSPIANMLDGDELVIVPDGPLCLVPYAACVDEASRYLSESTRIRILPSLTSLKLITDCPEDYHRKNGALLVGDPYVEEVKRRRGKRVRLASLPWAEEEVKIIGKILNTKPLTGREATKEEVLKRMGSVALVHIAAHGDMEAGEIALAPNLVRTSKVPKDKDYLLTMSDVQAVQLRAKLVVLSCCHSAQGKVTAEGVVGIGRAFLGAGARSVLVSLWAINDEATMEFMKCFYNHLGGGCSASVALNSAMKCLRESEKFGAVKYWAPFVLIGDDVTIDFGQNQ